MIAFRDIRDVLLGAAPPAATSYGLGRLLADTTWLPRSGHPEIFLERFNAYRLANARGWLDDLAMAFLCRAAAAVSASLQAWDSWVSNQQQKDGTPAQDLLTRPRSGHFTSKAKCGSDCCPARRTQCSC
jgi:hypothetical protein